MLDVALGRLPQRRVQQDLPPDRAPTLEPVRRQLRLVRQDARENEVNQLKKYEKEQDDIKHLKEFISSCGTYSKCAQAGAVEAEDHRQDDRRRAHPQAGGEGPQLHLPIPQRAPRCLRPCFAFDNVSFAYDGKKEDYLYRTWTLASTATLASRWWAPTARVSPRCSS